MIRYSGMNSRCRCDSFSSFKRKLKSCMILLKRNVKGDSILCKGCVNLVTLFETLIIYRTGMKGNLYGLRCIIIVRPLCSNVFFDLFFERFILFKQNNGDNLIIEEHVAAQWS